MKIFIGMLFFIVACQPSGNDSQDVKSLDDLERGIYVAEQCSSPSGQLYFNKENIVVYGQSCNLADKLTSSQQNACKQVIESLKTLPEDHQKLLNLVDMSILVDSKAKTRDMTQAAFQSDAISLSNTSSFWVATSTKTEDYLVTVLRADPGQNLQKEISYSLLRTLGDFFVRGAFSLRKPNGQQKFIFDPTITEFLPQQYLSAQAGLTKRFLGQVKNKEKNPLLMSIVNNNRALLENFPTQISQNPEARNLASFVTTEAFHQYYCNAKMKREFDQGGKYQDLAYDMSQIRSAIDVAIKTHSGMAHTIKTSANPGLGLTQVDLGSLMASFLAMFKQNPNAFAAAAPKGAEKTPVSRNAELEIDSSSKLANALAKSGCPNCKGGTCEGGNCTCAAGGCSCAGGNCKSCGNCKRFKRQQRA